jgi:hypothetical protein
MSSAVGKKNVTAVFLSPKFTLAILVGFLLALLVLFITRFPFPPGWDFRNNLWAPSFLLIQGQSPYNLTVLYELGSAVWMPVAIGLFWPIGFLPLQQASNLWWMLSLISLIAVVWLSSGFKRPPKLLFAITLFLAFIFPPTISHFSLGQITIFICLIFLVIAAYEHKFHPLLLAVLIILTLSKPQLAIFFLPGYFFSYLKKKGFSRAMQFMLYLIIALGIATLPLFIFYPQWTTDFLRNLTDNPAWAHPSSLFILRTNLINVGELLWWMLLIVGSGINLYLWVRLPIREAAVWSLALTTLITPYVWSWDFVLLIPLFTSYLYKKMPGYSTWLLYIAFISCWGVIAYMKLTGQTSDELYWWVPWYLVGFILITTCLVSTSTKIKLETIFKSKIPSFIAGED